MHNSTSDDIELSLSTCWATKSARQVDEVVSALHQTGQNAFELEYRIDAPVLAGLGEAFPARGWQVSSVHNFCPFPADAAKHKPSGDFFNLASADKEERLLAIRHSMRTIETAHDFEAPAVVLHLGFIPELADKKPTLEAMERGMMTPELAGMLEKRKAFAEKALDAVSFCLEALIERAIPLGVSLGLENRVHAFELPGLDETGLLLERFSGAPIGPWFDLGHAVLNQRAGLAMVGEWLHHYGGHFLGCHLHDVEKDRDHLAPGLGELDWAKVAGDLLHVPIKVMEVDPGPEADEIAEAAEMLKGCFRQALKDAQQGGEEGKGKSGEQSILL